VVVLHVGQQADLRAQTQEHVVVFIGFDHEQIALSGMRIRRQRENLRPEDEGRIRTQTPQDCDQHGCAGGLAM